MGTHTNHSSTQTTNHKPRKTRKKYVDPNQLDMCLLTRGEKLAAAQSACRRIGDRTAEHLGRGYIAACDAQRTHIPALQGSYDKRVKGYLRTAIAQDQGKHKTYNQPAQHMSLDQEINEGNDGLTNHETVSDNWDVEDRLIEDLDRRAAAQRVLAVVADAPGHLQTVAYGIMEDLTYEEIAEKLGVSTARVCQYLDELAARVTGGKTSGQLRLLEATVDVRSLPVRARTRRQRHRGEVIQEQGQQLSLLAA